MRTLGFILRIAILLAFFGLIGLVAFALVSDLPAPERQIVVPLEIPVDQ
ncbi:MAG: hypothetical protein AAF317_19530 [Pseudomonadota bacterium]